MFFVTGKYTETSTQTALELHIRCLWKQYTSDSVPRPPSATVKAGFLHRFRTVRSVYEIRNTVPLIERVGTFNLDNLRDVAPTSQIARQLGRIDQSVLSIIYSHLSRYGFQEWSPDLTETPYSPYNCAHRNACIDSFKQAMASMGYLFCAPDPEFAAVTDLLIRIFDNFVFHYMKHKFYNELKQPGSATQQKIANTVYKRRKKVRSI